MEQRSDSKSKRSDSKSPKMQRGGAANSQRRRRIVPWRVTKWKDMHAMQSCFCTHVLHGIHCELAVQRVGRGMDIRAFKNALESEGAIFG